MAVELKVPEVGESITEVQIGSWLKKEGDRCNKDENLVEIETDKATVELPAPIAGVITKVLKKNGDTAAVGEVIGYMDEAAVGVPAQPAHDHDDHAAAAAAKMQAAETIQTPHKTKEKPPSRVPEPGKHVPASSPAKAESAQVKPEPKPQPPANVAVSAAPASSAPPKSIAKSDGRKTPAETMPMTASMPRGPREEEAVPMSPIRRRIAQRLVEAQQTAALLTTFNEIDMSSVMALRNEHKDDFNDKYGIKLGFMSFFVKAAIDALKLVPQVNAEIRGNDIIYHNYFDIGIAVGGGKGLVVPVLRDADRLSFAEIELAIADLARRARENSLSLDELQGGTFTISNGGVYGSLMSTPIVNPPQSGILGLHAIKERPVAVGGQVVIRPMMYVALTYDHRIVDGAGAVSFLKRICEVIEEPLRMLVEV